MTQPGTFPSPNGGRTRSPWIWVLVIAGVLGLAAIIGLVGLVLALGRATDITNFAPCLSSDRPLQKDAYAGDVAKVTADLDGGAAVNGADKNGATPLGCALRAGAAGDGVVSVLLVRGADANLGFHVGDDPKTPLTEAVHTGDLAATTALLDKGADPNTADPLYGTPLQIARSDKRQQIADLLIARGARTTDTTKRSR